MELNFIDNSFIVKYHKSLANEAGANSAKALGWLNRESQQARFEAVAGVCDCTNASVLDVGCGTGDLRAFLSARFADTLYAGVDLMDIFLEIAAERYKDWPDTVFYHADIKEAILPAADHVLACGALSYHSSVEDHIYTMIRKLYDTAHVTFVFTLLSGVAEGTNIIRAHDPETIAEYCRTLCDNVTVTRGYWNEDFMVKMERYKR